MIGFIGLSHLGIVYSLATAAKGLPVVGFDPRPGLSAALNAGQFPIAEPGLEDLFRAHGSHIRFSADINDLASCELLFFSLDVPTDQANQSDLGPVRRLIDQIAGHLAPSAPAVILCQVPPGFTRRLKADWLRRPNGWGGNLFYQVETLIFGSAVERALHPERFIVGVESSHSPLPEAYANWLSAFGCPVLTMRYESAELAKISINLFLVSTVATTNTLAGLCEKTGADWSEITPALRLDKRIGLHAYLNPGLGLAGGNLERDLATAQALACEYGTEAGVIEAWHRNSLYCRDWVLRKTHELILSRKSNPVLAIWGLAYKPNTQSVKNSPALALIESLKPFAKNVFDPQVKLETGNDDRLRQCSSAQEACGGADGLIIMTPWSEFAKMDPAQVKAEMAGNVLIDPYGVCNTHACIAAGFSYHRLGVST